jgi:dTMP kinase
MLAGELRGRGFDLITTCEPGGTPLGRHLRRSFLETEETVSPLAELLLFAADRAQHVEFLIRPAIAAGRIVVSDRYADATAAYQGAGRGFEQQLVEQVIQIATGGLEPDLTIFFDIPVQVAIDRMSRRHDSESTRNRMDRETAEFYGKVRDEYLKIAERETDRFRVVDGTKAVDEVHSAVLDIALESLG